MFVIQSLDNEVQAWSQYLRISPGAVLFFGLMMIPRRNPVALCSSLFHLGSTKVFRVPCVRLVQEVLVDVKQTISGKHTEGHAQVSVDQFQTVQDSMKGTGLMSIVWDTTPNKVGQGGGGCLHTPSYVVSKFSLRAMASCPIGAVALTLAILLNRARNMGI